MTDVSMGRVVIARFDPTTAGVVYRRKARPQRRRRQPIVRYIGLDGTEELFEIAHAVPAEGPGGHAASAAQLHAVQNYFGIELHEEVSHRAAHTMLCVRDYAAAIAASASFTAARRALLGRFVAAYLLSDAALWTAVVRWCDHLEHGQDIRTGIASDHPYRKARAFIEKVIDDMRAEGADVFG